MPAPQAVLDLVARFDAQREAYASGKYNETQLRREFLDPLFEALGWDVANRQGHAEAYKDVIHEDQVKVGGLTKAPDYSFRVGGTRKFFVEAKKPAVNIKADTNPAYQLRRYAWSAKLPLSILTDFEELAVYDCRVRPSPGDKASTGRTLYIRYDELPARWDELAGIFGREAVLKGSFDRYAESRRGRRGTAEVDDAFLQDIEGWRELLARNLALRNAALGQRELNFAVQRIIDRIVFLRICEDRGLEQPERLRALVNGTGIYPRLVELFREADARYNSGLFHFREEKGREEAPDDLTPGLVVDDKALKEVISGLYYPESPYEFSVLPADILGQVYEQFLGKVIRLTAGHRAVVEEKPEVKKAGGVYYTPTYIVEYIVRQTVGFLLEGRTPRQADRLTVLDPACGSGSFLIGAYQYLLDWYRDRYVEEGPEKHRKVLYQGPGGAWRLTAAERKRILLNSIYGVDIDPQAVEVTKLSLLLKVLEGETSEALQHELSAFRTRALPDLGRNIKCGNSLIGPDFYDGKQFDAFSDEERLRINAFDWRAEFPQIFRREGGGFDAVIGNPPYVRMEGFKPLKPYLSANYTSHTDRADLYVYFLERASGLIRPDGLLGMIVSNKFVRARYGARLRSHLESQLRLRAIADFAGAKVFRGATVRTLILIGVNGQGGTATVYAPPPTKEALAKLAAGVLSVEDLFNSRGYTLPHAPGQPFPWSFARPAHQAVVDRLKLDSIPLADYVRVPVCYGVKSGLVEAFVVDRATAESIRRESRSCADIVREYITGKEIRRYSRTCGQSFLIYTPKGTSISHCSRIVRHLEKFRSRLEARATNQEWFELQQAQERYVALMKQPKIVYPDIAPDCRFTIDLAGHICGDTSFAIPLVDLPLLGVLNSRVALFYFRRVCAALEGDGSTFLRFKSQYIEAFPVPNGLRDGDNRLKDLVRSILVLSGAITEAGRELQSHDRRQIEHQEALIDEEVYRLYKLSPAEIQLVKEATEPAAASR